MFKEIKPGMVVDIIPATTLLTRQMNVKVMGTCGYEMAENYSDVAARHANIFSTLTGKDVDNDVWQYEYIIFKTPDGVTHAWPDAWIDKVNVVEKIQAMFRTTHSSMQELTELRNYLDARGIEYTITMQ